MLAIWSSAIGRLGETHEGDIDIGTGIDIDIDIDTNIDVIDMSVFVHWGSFMSTRIRSWTMTYSSNARTIRNYEI